MKKAQSNLPDWFANTRTTEMENKLFQRVKDQPDTELKPESNTTFYYPGNNKQIDFWVTPWGEVEKVFLVLNGKRIEIKKNKNNF